MLSARPDLKKYTALRFRQEVKRHADAIGPGEDVVLVFMEAQGLEPPLTLVCSDLHLEMEGYPVELFGPEQPNPPGLELMQQGQLEVVHLGPLFDEERAEGVESGAAEPG